MFLQRASILSILFITQPAEKSSGLLADTDPCGRFGPHNERFELRSGHDEEAGGCYATTHQTEKTWGRKASFCLFLPQPITPIVQLFTYHK